MNLLINLLPTNFPAWMSWFSCLLVVVCGSHQLSIPLIGITSGTCFAFSGVGRHFLVSFVSFHDFFPSLVFLGSYMHICSLPSPSWCTYSVLLTLWLSHTHALFITLAPNRLSLHYRLSQYGYSPFILL